MNVSRIVLGVSLIGFAAACASAPPPPPPPPPAAPVAAKAKPADQIGPANDLLRKGEYATAVASYDAILAKEPNNDVAKYNRALALQKMGKNDEAKAAYMAIVESNPKDAEAALNLGVILTETGEMDSAISVYKKALKNDEFHAGLLNNLSVLYRRKGRHRQAIETIRKVFMRDKENVDAYKNLALVYFDQKKYKLTQTILENAQKRAKKQKIEDPDIYVNLGMLYLATEENGKAMAAFKKAIGIDPNHVVANYNIGALALGHRDYGLAAKAYEVVAKAWPRDYEVQASLGYSYQGLQKLPQAAKHLEAARKLKLDQATASVSGASADEDEQMLFQLMVIKQNAQDNDGALQLAEEYMKQKNITCGEEDFDGFCGRYNGIKLTIQMEKEAAAAPPPEEDKPQTGQIDVFTDGPAEGDEAAAGAEGGEAGATGGEAPPAEGGGE